MESGFCGIACEVNVLGSPQMDVKRARSRVFNMKDVRLIGRKSFTDSWQRLLAFCCITGIMPSAQSILSLVITFLIVSHDWNCVPFKHDSDCQPFSLACFTRVSLKDSVKEPSNFLKKDSLLEQNLTAFRKFLGLPMF